MMRLKERNWNFDLQRFATPVQPVAGNTHDYTDADLAGKLNFAKLLEPGLNRIFFETYDEIPEQYSKVYNVKNSNKAIEREWGMGAFGDWTQRTDHFSTVDYQTISPGLERTYTHEAFTQGFMITREMYDDEQYSQMEKFAKAMARSGRAKVEKDAASFLLGGFTTPIYDGKALFAADHPLVDSADKVSNLMTGPLNEANLKTALKLMREQKDEAGNLIQMKATKLIIPPALEDTAIRLLGSNLLPGSELNDTNKFLTKQGIEIVVLDYLGAAAGGSDTVWFLQDGSRHELTFYWRTKMEFKSADDFDTFVAKYRGYCRYSLGASDFRGMIGSLGTVAP